MCAKRHAARIVAPEYPWTPRVLSDNALGIKGGYPWGGNLRGGQNPWREGMDTGDGRSNEERAVGSALPHACLSCGAVGEECTPRTAKPATLQDITGRIVSATVAARIEQLTTHLPCHKSSASTRLQHRTRGGVALHPAHHPPDPPRRRYFLC